MKPTRYMLIAVAILVVSGIAIELTTKPTSADVAAANQRASDSSATARVALDAPRNVRSSKPLAERQRIYLDLCVSERNATRPFLNRPNESDARQVSLETAQLVVQKRYAIDRAEYIGIMSEGVDQRWPDGFN